LDRGRVDPAPTIDKTKGTPIINTQPENTPRSVLVAMSGGVDSTVAAMLSIRDGLSCAGATMRLHTAESNGGGNDARTAAERLGIPYHVFDFTEPFTKHVLDRFTIAYLEGRTPNPCVDCNKRLKFGCFLEKALELGYDFIATGHFAQIGRGADGRYLLKKGTDPEKDQSYVLYGLTQEQLAHVLFPIGGLTKQQVRELARAEGLGNADKRESQDICFVPDGDYIGFIERRAGHPLRKGRFIDTEGNELGENKGVAAYTIGQRRGLGLAMPCPVYVLDIRPRDNTVVVGRGELLYSTTLELRDINLIAADKLPSKIRANVKIRYKHQEQPAIVQQTGEDTLHVEFDKPQRAITRGQAAVLYDGDTVLGGGTIV